MCVLSQAIARLWAGAPVLPVVLNGGCIPFDTVNDIYHSIMSSANSLRTHVPMTFDGTDWQVFSSLFKAYSMMSGFWGHLNSDKEEPMQLQPITIGKGDSAVTIPVSPKDMKEYSKELRDWKKYEECTLSCLTLSISLTVSEYIKDKSAKDAWAALKEKYGTPSAITVFGYFKELITFKLSVCSL
ncbi:hypothetical protein L218DRAFT_945657 [Marasmius fiardii PR-910]|nr:hypothetical protein L218DRAFT_945657 [Marasmius fiardii PR-910]